MTNHEPVRLPLTPTLALLSLAALALSAGWPPPLAARPPAGEAGPEESGPSFRRAPLPSDLERARVERWQEVWSEEAAVLEESFETTLRAAETSDDRGFRSRCAGLAGALLELERPRVLPVPDRAADLHLRRALRHVAAGALTCLTKRPYAARRELEQAAEAFGEVRRVLRRYRRGPAP